jgi:hypothetical protein
MINRKARTREEALSLIEQVNTDERISAQILDPETFEGYTTCAERQGGVCMALVPEKEGFHFISYADTDATDYGDVRGSIRTALYSSAEVKVTCAYVNPVNGQRVVSFVHSVTIVNDAGEERQYVLLRAMPLEIFEQIWVFPTTYQDSYIELIDRQGEFISPHSQIDRT